MSVLQDTTRERRDTRPINYLIKISISLCLLLLILKNVNPSATLRAISQITPYWLVLALALQLTSSAVASLRWCLIMQRIGFSNSFSFYLKSYFKGVFFNQGLPTSIGGDGMRILDCSRRQGSTLNSFYGVFIDRIVGLAGLLLLNIGALLFNSSLLPPKIHYLLLGILGCLTAGLVLLFFLRKFPFIRKIKPLAMLGELSERYYQVYSNVWDITQQLALSIVIHLFAMTAFYVLGRGMGLDYPLQVYLIMVPPVILLTILPISLAGWGVREGALVGFFLLIGADKSKVLSFSILYGLLLLVSSLPGLLVYLTQKNRV